jgi:transcriptional regulator with XRE-family HTH domain
LNSTEVFAKTTYKKIGANVAKIRKAKGISQSKLASTIGYSSFSYAEACRDDAHFDIEHLIKIAYVLEVDVAEFFDGVE